MTDPWVAILEELKANVAPLRERADALMENREKVPPTLQSPDQTEKAERLRLALMATADEIWSLGEECISSAHNTIDLLERTRRLWTQPLNEFSDELDGKIKKFRGDA